MTAQPAEAQAIQYAVLPWREGEAGVEILLATSRETRRWVIPKGWPIKNLEPWASAAREAWEEAGLLGDTATAAVGAYHYIKRRASGRDVWTRVEVFPMRVTGQDEAWPEQHQRSTRWFALADAADAVDEPELKALILAFVR